MPVTLGSSLASRVAVWRVLTCLLLLLLGGAVRAERLALLVSDDGKTVLDAAAGAESLGGVETVRFELFRGLPAVDAARSKLRSVPFQGVVAVGNSAYELLKSLGVRIPNAGVMVVGVKDPALIAFEAAPTQWLDLLERIRPGTRRIGAVAADPETVPVLARFASEFAKRGGELVIETPRAGEELEEAAARAVKAAPVFYLARDVDILKRKVLTRILNEAHSGRVLVLGFSDAFVKAGALASLEVSARDVGRLAAEVALGRTPSPLPVEISFNLKRAKFLEVAIPADLIGNPP